MKRILMALGCLLLTGCYPQRTGAYSLNDDSISYNQAVQSSVDSQLLLNIVRLRYRDTPTFLQVGIISSAYENKCVLDSNFRFDALNKPTSVVAIAPRVAVERTEKPTTTFQPVRGEGFVKEFLSPISLSTVVLLNSSGWKIDRILRCVVQRLNDIKNAPTASGPTPAYAPSYETFLELCACFAELEKKDAVDLVMGRHPKSGNLDAYLVIDKKQANPAALMRIWEILDLEPGTDHVKLVAYHGRRHAKNEVIVDTRSPLSVLYYLSQGVHVPESDYLLGKVTRTFDEQGQDFDWDKVLGGIIKIHSGPVPCGGFPSAMVHYRGTFFYIDDTDLTSKSTFSLLSQLLALQIVSPSLPTIALTIPLD